MVFAYKLNLCNIFGNLYSKLFSVFEITSRLIESVRWLCVNRPRLVRHVAVYVTRFQRTALALFSRAGLHVSPQLIV